MINYNKKDGEIMKWCISARQSRELLEKADEILVDWQDRAPIIDFIEWNPKARIILRLPTKENFLEKDYSKLIEYNTLCHNNFAVSVINDQQALKCKENNLTWFFAYPLHTFQQLYRVESLGASDAYIADELCHSLNTIEEYYPNLKIRVIANNVGSNILQDNQYLSGICGSWFRPEDLWLIPQIDVAEFYLQLNIVQGTEWNMRRQEQALYDIYAVKHEWSGKLEDFVFNIEQKDIYNELLGENFQPYRSNCGMRCMKTKTCHHCILYANLASTEMAEKIKKHIEKL